VSVGAIVAGALTAGAHAFRRHSASMSRRTDLSCRFT
jgi:hypothetical protein